MSKTSLSITVDSEVSSALDKVKNKKSEFVNGCLRTILFTEEGILARIEYETNELKKLQLDLEFTRKMKKRKINNLSKRAIEFLKLAKDAIIRNPRAKEIQLNMFNRDYQLGFTEGEFDEAVRKWCR